MAATTVTQEIRGGLRFLHKADRAAIRAAAVLLKLEGVKHPPTPVQLLKEHTFAVGTHTFAGTMTKKQADYLKTQTATLKKFAAAIAKVILHMNPLVLHALDDLDLALDAPGARRAPAPRESALDRVPVGCCDYDETRKDGVTEAFCVGGLQGNWSPHPC